MNCLTDYIGVIGCGAKVPDSELYINSLPSINLRQLQYIADSEQGNFLGVWNDIQVRAQAKLLVDVSALLRKKYKLNSFIESFKLSEKIGLNTFVSSNEFRGFQYDLESNNNVIKSDFNSINVEYLKLYLSTITTNPIAIQIIDIDTSEVLFVKTLDVISQLIGWNLIKVNKSFLNKRLKFVYNSNEITSVETNQDLLINHGCGCNNSHCGGELNGIKGINLGINTYGLVGKISLTCTYEPIICANKELFSGAFMYLLGSEIMVERLYTDRLNEYTTVKLEDAEKLHGIFLFDYEKQLEGIINGININLNDCCISCNSQLKVIEQTP